MNQNEIEFTAAEIRLLDGLYPVEDTNDRAFYWRLILDQRADNRANNLVDWNAIEGILRFAKRMHAGMARARVDPDKAAGEAWLMTFKRACGRTEGYSTLNEMSRLGAPEFAQKAREIVDRMLDATPAGERVKISWRMVLKKVLIHFKQMQQSVPLQKKIKPPPVPDPNDSEMDRLYVESLRLERELDEARRTQEGLVIALDLAKDKHQTDAATIATRTAERDAARQDGIWWQDFATAAVQPPLYPRQVVPPELVTQVLRAVEATRHNQSRPSVV